MNNVLAVDYGVENGQNYVTLLIDNTKSYGRIIDLISFTTTTETTTKNLLNKEIIVSSDRPTKLFQVDYSVLSTQNDEKANGIYSKLSNENLLASEGTPLIKAYSYGGGGTDSVLGGYTSLEFYSLTKNELEKSVFAVKSDVSTNGFITDHLINGTLNKTFRPSIAESGHFYHKFSDNVILDLDGLNFQREEETTKTTQPTSAKVMIGDNLFAIKRGNQTTYLDLYNEENSEY